MLIGAPFRVAVADFGLVRTTDSSGATPDVIGTPLYVAPELIEGQELSEGLLNRCDIYSLGVSAFELAACLRGDETTSVIPIILLSRPLAARSRRLLRDMGVEVLELPIEPGYLAKQVSRCLDTPGVSERHKATIVTG